LLFLFGCLSAPIAISLAFLSSLLPRSSLSCCGLAFRRPLLKILYLLFQICDLFLKFLLSGI